jgi:dihydrofolate synthase/folylpolyglutamate synthase
VTAQAGAPGSATEFLFSLERFGMKFGLAGMTRLCEALDHPERACPSIHVAGTNGKGSVTAMVDTALGAAGWRSARYTSPHLSRLEERFVIAGHEVSPDELEAGAARIRDAVDRLLAAGGLDGWPTFFECTTAVAFDLFREARADVAVLEAGLGGRLDATNVVSPIATAIVSIDFDHQAQLGDTLASIAFEKAGIVKAGVPVVVGALPPEAMDVIARVAAERNAPLVRAGDDEDLAARVAAMPIALPGVHQRANAAVALRLLETIDADPRHGIRVGGAARQRGVTAAVWPGRLETIVWQGRRILLDAAHNPAGSRALASYLAAEAPAGVTLVFGAMKDKAIAGMLRELAPVVRRLVCTTAPSPRAAGAGELAAMAAAAGLAAEAVDDPMAALARARAGTDPIVVAGSIFLVGAVRERLLS